MSGSLSLLRISSRHFFMSSSPPLLKTVPSHPFSTKIRPSTFTSRNYFSSFATAAGKPKPRKKNFLLLSVAGFGVGAAVGLGAGYFEDKDKKIQKQIPNVPEGPILLKEMPDVKASRSVKYPTDVTGLKLTLFQYQTCPFCCKVRALLDFFGISYDVVEVNSITRQQMKWSKTYKKVPVLLVETPEGQIIQLNDSSMIISALYSYFVANNGGRATAKENSLLSIAKYYPVIKFNDEAGKQQSDIMNKYFLMMDGNMGGRSKEDIVEERKWRKWTDDVLVHSLSPNIYRTIPEALDSFKYFDKVGQWEKIFSSFERSIIIYLGASAMWIIGKRLKKRYNLKDDVRQSLYDESDHWVKNIKKKGTPFMGGQSPNLADLAVYGSLSSIEGCQAFKDLTSHSKGLEIWYFGVKSSLKST